MLKKISHQLYFFLGAISASFLLIKIYFPEVVISTHIIYLPSILLLPIFDRLWKILDLKPIFGEDIYALKKNIYGYGIIIIIILLGYMKSWEFISLGFLVFLCVGILFKCNPKTSFFGALILLIYIPIYLVLGYPNVAETLSIYMYYFLVIGVVFQVTENIFPRQWILGK